MSNNSGCQIWPIFWPIYRRYIVGISLTFADIGKITKICTDKRVCFMRCFVSNIVPDILVYNRYIGNIGLYFLIFPSINVRLLILCREGPTLEMSMIYRDISILSCRYLVVGLRFPFPTFFISFSIIPVSIRSIHMLTLSVYC